MDNKKLILGCFILLSLVVGAYAAQIVQYVYVNFYQIRRVLAGLEWVRDAIPVAVGGLLFMFLISHRRTNGFMEEVISELKKVTWPGRQDVIRSTTVVIICILVASVILATFDMIWGRLMGYLLA